jgi:H+/Cl- antiporter ClcA
VVAPRDIPGVFLAALGTLSFGAVLGPEAPLLALGGGMAAWAVARVWAGRGDRAKVVIAAAGSFAAVSTLLGSPLAGAFLLMEAAGRAGSGGPGRGNPAVGAAAAGRSGAAPADLDAGCRAGGRRTRRTVQPAGRKVRS